VFFTILNVDKSEGKHLLIVGTNARAESVEVAALLHAMLEG
jgi:hypothetical protein